MCSLFGWLDYKGIVPHRMLRKLTQALANAAEERGTDAAGISYVKDGKVVIYKRPKPAHRIHFHVPDGTTAVIGHTRLATQGDVKQNFNNHPFHGVAGETEFAFAHNGVLWNDNELRKEKLIPETHIETDSYAACQLIESQQKLDFDSLKYMAETVEGNFTFSILDEHNRLYIIKGSNPMCLLHFKALGLYVYASTESIMKKALKSVGLYRFASEKVDTIEGDILCIDSSGNITKARFEPAPTYTKHSRYSGFGGWYGYYGDYINEYEEALLTYCNCYGVDSSDVELLLEYGYTCDEIEEMLMDHSLLHQALSDIKDVYGDKMCERYCGVF